MAYYYRSHIRNLQEQALIEKKKIAAELYQKQLLKQSQLDEHALDSSRQKPSRKTQDQQTAAYLQRSRLSAELSAMRTKAQNSMNRSRLQSAFQLRKQNQQAIQELQKMDRKHAFVIQRGLRWEYEAQINVANSHRKAEEAIMEEDRVNRFLLYANDIKYKRQLTKAYQLQSAMKPRYAYPY